VPESCWRNFLTRTGLVQHWTNFCGRLTQLQGLQTGNPSAAENVRSAQETCKCLRKWWPLWAQTVTGGIAYELVRRLFHTRNFCFWAPFFKQLLLKNCAVDFVEICNVCTKKVIIKAAKRIFNSDTICCSYWFLFWRHFFWNTLYIKFLAIIFGIGVMKVLTQTAQWGLLEMAHAPRLTVGSSISVDSKYNTIVTWSTLIFKIKSSSSVLQSQYCLCSDVKGAVIEMWL